MPLEPRRPSGASHKRESAQPDNTEIHAADQDARTLVGGAQTKPWRRDAESTEVLSLIASSLLLGRGGLGLLTAAGSLRNPHPCVKAAPALTINMCFFPAETGCQNQNGRKSWTPRGRVLIMTLLVSTTIAQTLRVNRKTIRVVWGCRVSSSGTSASLFFCFPTV